MTSKREEKKHEKENAVFNQLEGEHAFIHIFAVVVVSDGLG